MLNSLPVPSSLHLARWRKLLPQFETLEVSLQNESDRELRKRSLSLRFQAKSGEKLRNLVPEGFALMREAARRTLGMRHFDVQMLGGLALINNCIATHAPNEKPATQQILEFVLYCCNQSKTLAASLNSPSPSS